MNIVMVVHQPRYSMFNMFHEVLFLGKQGRTVFLGPPTTVLPYFGSLGFDLPPNWNPADFCLDVISGAVPCRGRPDFQPEVPRILSKPSITPATQPPDKAIESLDSCPPSSNSGAENRVSLTNRDLCMVTYIYHYQALHLQMDCSLPQMRCRLSRAQKSAFSWFLM